MRTVAPDIAMRVLVGLPVVALVVTPWLVALPGCWTNRIAASTYLEEAGGLDAVGDLRHADLLLGAGMLGTAAAVACVAWLLHRRSAYAALASLSQGAFGLWFAVGDYAEPVVLLPTGLTWLVAWILGSAILAVGMWAHTIVRRG